MKIASFNINDVNKRLGNLIGWLRTEKPDVVALQELKAADPEFPKAAIEKAGYGVVWRGQKTWNGVAILARGCEPIVTRRELPGNPDDRQARYIEAAVKGVIVTSLLRRTAIRSRGRNSTTSSPGWSACWPMPKGFTLLACRWCSPA
jgi:exodeoxyribonuclease-3